MNSNEFIRPIRVDDDIRKDYLTTNRLSREVLALRNSVALILRGYGRSRSISSSNYHPFKLYQFSNILRDDRDADEDWRKFLVRSGLVFLDDANGLLPSGTDEVDFPDSDTLADLGAVDEILVPAATAKYWFWIEIADDNSNAAIRHAADPTVFHATFNPNPWDDFPDMDGFHIPIGYVDTNTNASEKIALVRQFVRTDLVGVSGGSDCPVL
jgi:hypothetical protein